MRLLPREEKFFTYLLGQADLIREASNALLSALRDGNSHLEEAAVKIRNFEQRGDEIIHEVFKALNRTFITPLDPEDLHSLASYLDDVLDAIEDVSQRLVDYRIDPVTPPMVEMAARIASCAQALQRAFDALDKDEKLLVHCIEINRLEEEVDELLRLAIMELFDTERDPIRVIKYKEVYEFLELAADRCEDVADALQNVVIKNS